MSVRAAIFDLDGTLVETAPDLHAVLAAVLAEEGRPIPALDDVRRMVGDGAKALLVRGFAFGGVKVEGQELERLYGRFLEIYVAEPCVHSYAYPGVEATLLELRERGVALGVCTNKPQRPSELLLEKLGLAKYLGAIVGGDVLRVRKPDPAHLLHAIEALGVPHGAAMMVGDSRNDLMAARAAGVPCVLVSFGYTDTPAAELGADRVIDRFDELPALLRAWPAGA